MQYYYSKCENHKRCSLTSVSVFLIGNDGLVESIVLTGSVQNNINFTTTGAGNLTVFTTTKRKPCISPHFLK